MNNLNNTFNSPVSGAQLNSATPTTDSSAPQFAGKTVEEENPAIIQFKTYLDKKTEKLDRSQRTYKSILPKNRLSQNVSDIQASNG